MRLMNIVCSMLLGNIYLLLGANSHDQLNRAAQPLLLTHMQSDQNFQASSFGHFYTKALKMLENNQICSAGICTTLALLVIFERLSNKGIIKSQFSLSRIKEKVYGVPVYKGHEYYKNWRHPENLLKKIPHYHKNVSYSFYARTHYESEMSDLLLRLEKLLEQQENFKKISWYHEGYIKEFKSVMVDQVYISEAEESQLDDDLTNQLANCRSFTLRSIKNQIIKLQVLFENISHQLVFYFKKIITDIKNFKIDHSLVVLSSLVAYQMHHPESLDNSYVDDFDIASMQYSKKKMYILYTQIVEKIALINIFEKIFDTNQFFFMEYLSQQPYFIKDATTYYSLESFVSEIQMNMQQQKNILYACLERIITCCKQKGHGKMISSCAKYIKKVTAEQLKKYYQHPDQVCTVYQHEYLDIQELFSLFLGSDFLQG